MSEDDSKLFREFVGEVKPLKREPTASGFRSREPTPGTLERRRAAEERTAGRVNFLDDVERIEPVKPWDELSWKRDGVQHGVFKNLRQGKYLADTRLDLHRLTVDQARRAVFQFINDCVAYDVRCALITHGRGERRDNPALLKSCVNHWLRQMDPVLAFHSAQRRHGGTGATYVLVRKSAEKREENRERFSKRKG